MHCTPYLFIFIISEIHRAVAVHVILIDLNDDVILNEYFVKTSDDQRDPAVQLILYLLSQEKYLMSLTQSHSTMSAEVRERGTFEKKRVTKCYLCHKGFKNSEDMVTDHCHYEGKFLGISCNKCNLNRKSQVKIPVFFHNSRGYDSNIIASAINEVVEILGQEIIFCKDDEMRTSEKERKADEEGVTFSVLAKNGQRLRVIRICAFEFRDSMEHLAASLSKLVEQILPKDHKFTVLRKVLSQRYGTKKCTEGIGFCLAKLPFPYAFLSDMQKLKVPLAGISKEFDPPLNETDSNTLECVIRCFDLRNLEDLVELYNRVDVCLLAETLSYHRKNAHKSTGLDPLYYVSASSFARDIFLFRTGTKLRLMRDLELYEFFWDSIRGGVSFSGIKKAESHKIDEECFNTDQPCKHATIPQNEWNTFVSYLDVNNLYGCALTMSHSASEPRFVTDQSELTGLLNKIQSGYVPSGKEEVGYFVEVDLEYPQHLHSAHSEFPFAAEKRTITREMLSPRTCELLEQAGRSKVEESRLITSLLPKRNYIAHLQNVCQYVSNGLKVTKLHRAVKFYQKPLFSDHVLEMARLRGEAQSSVQKQLYKDLVNHLYGKMLENPRKYLSSKIVRTDMLLMRYCASELLKSFTVLGDNCVLVHSAPQKVKLNSPIQLGASILEQSKFIFSELYSKALKPNLQNARTVLSDTDSVVVQYEAPCYNMAISAIRPLLDLSNFPKEHPLYDNSHANALFLLKDEMRGRGIKCVYSLRSKTYAIACHDEEKSAAKIVCKGISRKIFGTSELNYAHFERCAETGIPHTATMTNFRAQNHVIRTLKLEKCALSLIDMKRYLLNCSVHTYAFGDYRIERSGGYCHQCGI